MGPVQGKAAKLTLPKLVQAVALQNRVVDAFKCVAPCVCVCVCVFVCSVVAPLTRHAVSLHVVAGVVQ